MKRFVTLSTLTALVLLLSQCAPKPKAAMTASGPVKPASASRFSAGFSAEEAEQGRMVYQDYCGRCHKLFTPESRTLKQWEHILPEMYGKAKLTGEKTHLIDAYVAKNARAN